MKNVSVLKSRSVNYLLTKLRNEKTNHKHFVVYADRLLTLLSEEGLSSTPNIFLGTVKTPCGVSEGFLENEKLDLCVVSIFRSGDVLKEAIRRLNPNIKVGEILIQRNEKTKQKEAVLFYTKLPKNLGNSFIIITDPMLASGGSFIKTVEILKKNNASEKNILFLNVISCPEGIKKVHSRFPNIKIITCSVDEKLSSDKYIVPGLGDFGDRYYGT